MNQLKAISYSTFFFLLLTTFVSVLFFNLKTTKTKKPVLKILTYSSFISLYGPGRSLKAEFEKSCHCEVQWMAGENSTGLIQRLALNLKTDLVIGLDQLSLLKTDSSRWKKISYEKENFIAEVKNFLHPVFVPINWAPIGWIYKKSFNQRLTTLSDLVLLHKKISFPGPHSSTLGLQFYYWIYNYYSGNTEHIRKFLQKLKPKIYGNLSSWSLAYGFFQKDHVALSLSYLTSLAYHVNEESSHDYRFAYFNEGHPYQVEFAGIPENCENCQTASDFVKFLLSLKAQNLIMKTHYMFPVINHVREGIFLDLHLPPLISYKDMESFHLRNQELLKLWKEVLY